MASGEAGRFGYFMLQARADAGWSGNPTVRGVIENLATGERWPFESAEEAAARLVSWSRASRSTAVHPRDA